MNEKVKLADLYDFTEHCVMKRKPDLITFPDFNTERSQFKSSNCGFLNIREKGRQMSCQLFPPCQSLVLPSPSQIISFE